jgi:Na+-translocating ferredoxin:NAD+ oxidoreductase RnfD subunit
MQPRPLDMIVRINRIALPRRQRGQASAEYLVVASALVLALLFGAELPPVAALIAALKSCFGAYSFALSLP